MNPVAKVRRGDQFVLGRAHLAYLNAAKKLNCAFCTYANGVAAYAREVASRIEEYWCPIKHAKRIIGAHRRYSGFEDFGDAEAYATRLAARLSGMGMVTPGYSGRIKILMSAGSRVGRFADQVPLRGQGLPRSAMASGWPMAGRPGVTADISWSALDASAIVAHIA